MQRKSLSELIVEAESRLAHVKKIVIEQSTLVERLEEIGADHSDATEFLRNLQERQSNLERRLAYLRTRPDSDTGTNGTPAIP